MDSKLRELERRAAGGDEGAERRLLIEQMRIKKYYPTNLQFGGLEGVPAAGNRWLASSDSTLAQILHGPILGTEGILRGIAIWTDRVSNHNYRIQAMKLGDTPGVHYNNKTRGSLLLKVGESAGSRRDLLVRTPALVPIGVSMEREGSEYLRSTFSAICVTLEIWIPEVGNWDG